MKLEVCLLTVRSKALRQLRPEGGEFVSVFGTWLGILGKLSCVRLSCDIEIVTVHGGRVH